MENISVNETQKQLLLSALHVQKKELLLQIKEIDKLVNKINNSGVEKEDITLFNNYREPKYEQIDFKVIGKASSVDTWFDKVKFVLSNEKAPLTSREILTRMYEYFNDMTKANDRKYIASISAILTQKIEEGTDLIKIKNENEHSRFALREKHENSMDVTYENDKK